MDPLTFEEKPKRTLAEYKDLFFRRRNAMLLWFAIVAFAGIVTTLVLPPKFRSQAVILIEEQDVPQDLVRSTITTYAVQRIEEIKQRIMTVSNIINIVETYNVYSDEDMKKLTRTEIASRFRKNVAIEPIRADVIDPLSGRPTQTVIAFKLTFHGKDPSVVHKVTNELVTLYLNENQRERTEQSTSTSNFLQSEALALDKQLKRLEKEISDFKDQNHGALPELNTFNLNILDRSERELIDISSRIQQLETRKIDLSSQIVQLSPSAPTILANGQAVLSEADRLEALESELRAKTAVYQAGHPDLSRLKREIKALTDVSSQKSRHESIAKELDDTQMMLAQAKDTYRTDHPDVVRLKSIVADLEAKLSQTPKENVEVKPDNPAYILLSSQIDAIDVEIASLNRKREIISKKIADYERRLLRSPAVEKDYQALLRDYENTRLKYRAIETKQLQAELGKNLEHERKGERFTLIQPPEVPEKPMSPNRAVLAFLTAFLSLGAAIGSALTFEAIDPGVYGQQNISFVTGMTPLICIPNMLREKEIESKRRKLMLYIIVAVIACALTVVLFHIFIKPLDVTWYILMRKLDLLF